MEFRAVTMKKLLLALAFLLPTSGAWAQCNGTFPNNTVCGNITGSGNLPRPTNPSAFQGSAGGTNGQQQYNNAGALGGFTQSGDVTVNTSSGVSAIQPGVVSNSKLVTGASNTVKGTVNGSSTTDLAVTSCSVAYRFTQWITGTGWSCGISPILPSRTVAATLDLSAFSAVTTQGYANPGDGGGAVFIKTAGRFRDTVVSTGTITNAGSGYTTGTYRGVAMTGSATGLYTYANIVVAGGVITSVTVLDVYGRGAGSLVGDVLTAGAGDIGGTGSGFTWTVATVTTALASFTDSAGNRFQYVVDSGNYINPRAFGCKFDFVGVDATATNDGACLQASLNFASISRYPRQDFGGATASTRVVLPAGSALICQTLTIPIATQLVGQGMFNSVLKVCDSGLNANSHVVILCDPNMRLACFGSQVANLNINAFNAAGNANAWGIYSNAAQQAKWIDNVSIYSGARGCIKYEVGYGGAANANAYDVFCTINTGSVNAGVEINTGTTVSNFHNLVVESGGVGLTGVGVNLLGGQIAINGFHSEGITRPINVNMTTATFSAVVMNATGGNGCGGLVTLQSINTPGNFAIFNAVKNGCSPNLVTNGQPAGSNRTADAKPVNGWVSFNP